MDKNKLKGIIEAILFAAGREVKLNELMSALELSQDEVVELIESMKLQYENESKGIQIINVDGAYQLCTKKEYYDFIYPVFDKRSKPNLSQAALETLSIIAYNPKITRAEIEAIRGVNSDGTIYKLLDYNLIEDSGKLDAPGRPTTYSTTKEFLRMFGLESLDALPELPRYKLDENKQIVIEDIIEELKENSYINDNNYIQRAIAEYIALKNLSMKEIKYKLFAKGLNNDIIDEYFSNNKDDLIDYEIQSIKNIYYKKQYSMDKEEIKQFLIKKGYQMENIKEALSEVE